MAKRYTNEGLVKVYNRRIKLGKGVIAGNVLVGVAAVLLPVSLPLAFFALPAIGVLGGAQHIVNSKRHRDVVQAKIAPPSSSKPTPVLTQESPELSKEISTPAITQNPIQYSYKKLNIVPNSPPAVNNQKLALANNQPIFKKPSGLKRLREIVLGEDYHTQAIELLKMAHDLGENPTLANGRRITMKSDMNNDANQPSRHRIVFTAPNEIAKLEGKTLTIDYTIAAGANLDALTSADFSNIQFICQHPSYKNKAPTNEPINDIDMHLREVGNGSIAYNYIFKNIASDVRFEHNQKFPPTQNCGAR